MSLLLLTSVLSLLWRLLHLDTWILPIYQHIRWILSPRNTDLLLKESLLREHTTARTLTYVDVDFLPKEALLAIVEKVRGGRSGGGGGGRGGGGGGGGGGSGRIVVAVVAVVV
jgi:uncharacterized membrane protein YgcG